MYLEQIKCPADVKKVAAEELPALAAEIRQRLIQVVSCTGGHLGSSLGAVELIIALHYCLEMPPDKIIFDVGHQAYAHKLLTGRAAAFSTQRQCGGLSGFPNSRESAYDIFTTGHSSTAVSLALGISCAKDHALSVRVGKVVAVIGDGSLSGGLCFEGLNNAGHLKKDILVVLNTNELSIAPNVGALSTYLNKIISLPLYNRFRDSLEHLVRSRIPKESRILKLAHKFEEGLKGLFIPGLFFEELGFRYFGPFDGHDLGLLTGTLKNIIPMKGPILLHVITKKGKGYSPAEQDPVRFHGVGAFETDSGVPKTAGKGSFPSTYTEIFGAHIVALARENKKIIAITAAMPEGTGLDRFRDQYPERFFDVGIAESHAVCFAAGLAKAGLRPVVAVYSTFLQRAYDQLIEDIALQDLPVVFALDRAGIVGEDGATHQGIFDIAYLRSIPGMTIMAPGDAEELKEMFTFAFSCRGPVAIRYPKGKAPCSRDRRRVPLTMGTPEVLGKGKDFCLIALGSMLQPAQEVIDVLSKEGIAGTLLNARFVKPLDIPVLRGLTEGFMTICTAEEGILDGGFGSAVAEALGRPVVKMGLPCAFIPHGHREVFLEEYGLTPAKMARTIKAALQADNQCPR